MADQVAALAIWQRIGDTRKEGKNRCHLASLLWAQGRIVEAELEAEATVALMEQLQAGPELALAYGTLARLRGTTLADGEAIQLGEMAVALAERTGATETLVDALLTVGEANLARGAIGEGRQRIELGMRLATEAGLDELTARAFICLGHGFSECAHFATAVEHFERGIAYCVERDLDLPRHHMTVLLARCHLSLGTWDDALRLAMSVLDGRDVAPGARFDALLVVGLLRARRGDAGASPMLDEALALAEVSGCVYFIGPVRAARAEAAFLSGDAVVAAAEARAAYDFAIERQHRRHASELAYWLWRAGELVVPPPDIFEPYAYQIAGDWRAAAAAWDAVGCPYEAARAWAEGDDADALRAALAVFDRLGANPATAMTGRRLRGLGGSVPRGPRATTRGNPAGLTRREAEVVRLLAEEHSNREIAVRLFLSARTVEHHVAAVLAKLAVGSRSDAVREAARQGLVAGPRSQSR
jgi:DNA-binding CsgD family transcriptional regulator